jgi:hypothetical protein
LNALGYHHASPFTEHHSLSDIYSTLTPDLLHQITKCFYDYVHKWMIAIIEGIKGLSTKEATGEIDAPFSQIPPYSGLRHFRRGIYVISRWQGNEFKSMLQTYLGVMKGLVPDNALKLVQTYLDIHRMSHYMSHSEATLDLLTTAIEKFWKQLWDPKGLFVLHAGISPGWHCPKLHYMQHYVDAIRRWGSLSYCSTNRTEKLHKSVKDSYRRSNKGPQAIDFSLRDEARQFGWAAWEAGLPANTESHLSAAVALMDIESESTTADDAPGTEDDSTDDEEPSYAVEWEEDSPPVSNESKPPCIKTIKFTNPKMPLASVATVQRKLGQGFETLAEETMAYLSWRQGGRQHVSRKRSRQMYEP